MMRGQFADIEAFVFFCLCEALFLFIISFWRLLDFNISLYLPR